MAHKKIVIPHEYASLGSPDVRCANCNAQMWKEERVNKNVNRESPIFLFVARKVRLYNSMFAFTSAGGNVDHFINGGRGPYIYKLNGQNHHVFSSLIPNDGDTPKFCQLYIYNTVNEVNNRLRWVNNADQFKVNAHVIEGLIQILDETNDICQEFRMARDRFENNDIVNLKVELKVCWAQSGRENHISASDDVARIMVGGTDTPTVNRDIIVYSKMDKLKPGYAGSKCYMQHNFQDALVVCRHVGHPDIFLTMTCNTIWDEIQKMIVYLPGCQSQNCPNIISRVFKMKPDQMTNDIKKKSYFGKCVGIMYVFEFHKRGLPHVHMLIWLDCDSKKFLRHNVDKFVSAEIPDPVKDPVGYAAVKAYMIYGHCGLQNPKSPCMKGIKCTRHFPKK
ncbi:uncharacterized protein LOC141685526 [Apium graveolens]|uniref:uncharacterized protein LOC141685526 n=1 Tax=Apium graveolens TaxID=4045 RepID=UPI003D78E7A1